MDRVVVKFEKAEHYKARCIMLLASKWEIGHIFCLGEYDHNWYRIIILHDIVTFCA